MHTNGTGGFGYGPVRVLLLQYGLVSDWRQIQARIRKARTSADPPGQLSALFDRTRDAMVAFELAQIHEKAGAIAEAIHWYTKAVERFRRPQWKQKAEEGLTRLGAPVPVQSTPGAAATETESVPEPVANVTPIIAEFSDEQPEETQLEAAEGQQESVFEQQPTAAPPSSPEPVAERPRRRRGRRGGRGRHKGERETSSNSAAPRTAQVPPSMFDRVAESRPEPVAGSVASVEPAESRRREPDAPPAYEHIPAAPSTASRVRSGDPALSSRMAQLESQLRRLLACSIHSLEEPEEAPAGPGVFLITDTDQTTYYYVEACQTLRVGVGNLLRGSRGSHDGANLKEKLGEHLGINETRVGKYLKEHCGVRWLQLDDGAPLLAHFAVAVLRPIANE